MANYEYGIVCQSPDDVQGVLDQYSPWSEEVSGASIWAYKCRNYPGSNSIVMYIKDGIARGWDTYEIFKNRYPHLPLCEYDAGETFNDTALEVILGVTL